MGRGGGAMGTGGGVGARWTGKEEGAGKLE